MRKVIGSLTCFLNISGPLVNNAAIIIRAPKRRRIFPLDAERQPYFEVESQQFSERFSRIGFSFPIDRGEAS